MLQVCQTVRYQAKQSTTKETGPSNQTLRGVNASLATKEIEVLQLFTLFFVSRQTDEKRFKAEVRTKYLFQLDTEDIKTDGAAGDKR